MALCAIFEYPGSTKEQYDEGCREINNGQPLRSLSDWPVPGILSHVTGPTADGWYVVDVWESKEAFEQSGRFMMPVLDKIGMPNVAPRAVYEVHNLVRQ